MLFRYIYLVTTAVIFKFAVMQSMYRGIHTCMGLERVRQK